MSIKAILIKVHSISCQFGIDPLRFLRSCRGLPRYFSDWIVFRRRHVGRMTPMPCLNDRYEEGGVTKSEYFWQDLSVARWINEAKPLRHADIGSRVDGFVAHVASFREIEVFDVRPISTVVPGIVFRQADLMASAAETTIEGGEQFDSLSCLHAVEHFGLGRYGDPIDSSGYRRGIANMARLVKPGGTLYLSTPVGKERVEFNANWVFDPRTIAGCASDNGLILQKLTIITPADGPREVLVNAATLEEVARHEYVLGIFCFTKQLATP